jgi:TatD DNase family protein
LHTNKSRVQNVSFVDAHLHLSDEEYTEHTDEVVAEAKQSNVVAMVSNSMDFKTCRGNLKLAEKHPRTVYVALGIHPWNVQRMTEAEIRRTIKLIEQRKKDEAVVAIGEVGLDGKYDTALEKQLSVFEEMLHVAEKLDLPVIIHSRGTTVQILDLLPSFRLRGVLLHWFSNPVSALSRALERGYLITEGPPIVYSKGIREVVDRVPLDSLMTETDGPVRYFKPPFEGKRTTPALIPTVVKAMAEVKKLEMNEVGERIRENFERFFRVKLN